MNLNIFHLNSMLLLIIKMNINFFWFFIGENIRAEVYITRSFWLTIVILFKVEIKQDLYIVNPWNTQYVIMSLYVLDILTSKTIETKDDSYIYHIGVGFGILTLMCIFALILIRKYKIRNCSRRITATIKADSTWINFNIVKIIKAY